MDYPKGATRAVAERARESFDEFIRKRRTVFPTIFDRMRRGGRGRARLVSPFALLSLNNHRVRKKRYVFFSARHAELIALFGRDEAVLIGGPRELRLAMTLGLPFCFSGDLYYASYHILFGQSANPLSWVSGLVLDRWIRFFLQQETPCYLVMPNDTLPIPLLLAKIAGESGNVRVVCVQHGLFNAGYEYDDIDGRNSQFNLVYSSEQRREMLRRMPGASVEVMGYPAEYYCEAPQTPHPRRAVLVGTGALEDMKVYARTLAIFANIATAMMERDCRVEYRPHPTERRAHFDGFGFVVNAEEKKALLSNECRVFFGFTSTLLYEAHLAGHVVVILNDPCHAGYNIEQFGLRIQTSDMGNVASMVAREWQRKTTQKMERTSTLRVRFEEAIGRAEARFLTARRECEGC